MSIIDNYNSIIEEINNIALSCERDVSNIKIVAVSKTFPADIVQNAINQGITLLGENKIQEAKQKIPLLNGDFETHFIGHLQSNKAKDAVKLFEVLHAIDKLSSASKVDMEAEKISKKQKILVQANTSGENTKNGVKPEDAVHLCKDIQKLKNVELLGLMTIGPFTRNENSIRESFKMLNRLLMEINDALGTNMTELSMGMSSDYSIAVEEGATILRIGSAIFGARDYAP